MRIIERAIAGPALMVVVVTAGTLVLAPFGAHPFWRVEDLTLSEAALLRDDGEVTRLIALAEDPNERYAVRRTFTGEPTAEMTPLAAAVRARRAEMVSLLLAHGARPDADTWALVVCEPAEGEMREIRQLLAPLMPATPCPPATGADLHSTSR